MSDSADADSEKVTEEDILVQTPYGERYPSSEINLTGTVSSSDE